jgi:hypothetical protein
VRFAFYAVEMHTAGIFFIGFRNGMVGITGKALFGKSD